MVVGHAVKNCKLNTCPKIFMVHVMNYLFPNHLGEPLKLFAESGNLIIFFFVGVLNLSFLWYSKYKCV